MREALTRAGDRVRFDIEDVLLPDAEELHRLMPDATEMEGSIVDFSDSGSTPSAFAIVEVIAKRTVVVPIDKLR